MAKMKKILTNLGVFVVATGLAVLLAEFGARLFLNSSDFLGLEVVGDPVLGWVPSPSAMAGFDKWGFRNREVPKTADIVAVGDSHTYGNTARMVDSWPYVLGHLTGLQVYNMGVGGYGPNQYFYLSKTKALSLKPHMIIWGLYMGDDFEGAYSLTYGLEPWAYLRALPPRKVDPNVWEAPPSNTRGKRMRVWLSRHSVLYQVVLHSGIGGKVSGQVEIRNAAQLYPGQATSLILPEKHIAEAFRPKGMLTRLDQQDPNVREGMRITFELLKEMNDICQQNHIQFLVVVIPTKESVFSNYLEHNSKLPLDDVIDQVLVNERLAREQLFRFMSESKIPYVDALPALQKAVAESRYPSLYASSGTDMHPNKNGYHVIAEATAEVVKNRNSQVDHR
jgi:hypothetical protein